MPYITECKAPDIADLGSTLFSRTITGLVFHGRKHPESDCASRLMTGYLIVVDKAVREYTAGRNALMTYAKSENKTSQLLEGLGRFETCIHSAKRAFRFLERMAATPESPAVDRTLRRLIRSRERTLTHIRDAIEHIDEDITAETGLVVGMAHLLAINHDGDYLEISSHRLALVDLAKVVRSLHQAGCELLAELPVPTHTEVPRA